MADYQAQFRGFKATHISTSATTLVKTGAGLLNSVVVNNPGTGNTVTVYDGVDNTGTVLAVLGAVAASATLRFEVAFTVGLCVVTAAGTPADLTVTYL